MKRAAGYLGIVCTAWLMMAGALSAANRFGAGIVLGDPSGLTGKLFISGSDAVDFGLGASAHDGFYLYADYLRHFAGVFPVGELALYLGAGGGFRNHDHDESDRHDHDDENSLEVRVPIGVEYTVRQVPLGIFLELVPALELVPDVDFHLRGGLGARYFF
ncbi:MAG TPA: hypothetical protein PKY31_15985 [Spirochaetota bacterium]|nr:hypothetical protein [Spirochaetota bacterium]